MKKTLRVALVAGAVVWTTGMTTASAQISETITFKTTFPFVAGGTRFPAGTYTIEPDENSQTVLVVRGHDVSAFVETVWEPPRKAELARLELVFKHDGNDYVLRELWDPNSRSGVQARLSAAARRREEARGDPGETTKVPATRGGEARG